SADPRRARVGTGPGRRTGGPDPRRVPPWTDGAGDMNGLRPRRLGGLVFLALLAAAGAPGAEPSTFDPISREYSGAIRPLVAKSCLECHWTDAQEGDLDLERFAQLGDVRREPKSWQKVAEMVGNGEMPPKEGRRLPPSERKTLLGWVERYLKAEAHASAGDP